MAARRADPARALGLLWGAGKTGRSGLTVAGIVRAAVELADAAGQLDSVGMRQVAERLGVGTMSLYTHVPGKPELTDLMIDMCLAELYTDLDEPARQPGGWRAALRFVADRHWRLYTDHPWLLQIPGGRPMLGPNATRQYEAELRPLDGIGLSDVETDSVRSLVLSHVAGVARTQVSLRQARAEQSDTEWWLSVAPALERVMNGADFPLAARIGQAAAEAYQGAADPLHDLVFGLNRILDGTEALLTSRRS